MSPSKASMIVFTTDELSSEGIILFWNFFIQNLNSKQEISSVCTLEKILSIVIIGNYHTHEAFENHLTERASMILKCPQWNISIKGELHQESLVFFMDFPSLVFCLV